MTPTRGFGGHKHDGRADARRNPVSTRQESVLSVHTLNTVGDTEG